MKYFYLFVLVALGLAARSQTPMGFLYGRVVTGEGQPVAGANVTLAGTNMRTVSDGGGLFTLKAAPGSYQLLVSYLGLKTAEQAIRIPLKDSLTVMLQPIARQLNEVVVSTGYQELPKERATGSFVQAGRMLLERSTSTDIIDRLRDVIPGLSFNNVGTRISIRGQSTLFSNADPLIVVDGFPYNEPIENLNPNDVESISVLKDAAAASIWGSKAGNGVIVVTTKKGSFNRPVTVTFNANVTVGGRPDLFSLNRMSSSDYIDIEKRLFSQGFFTATESSVARQPLSPVVELLIAQRDGKISPADAGRQIDVLRSVDTRNDQLKYLYRPSARQQYAISLDGGSEANRYYFSAGYDKNLDNLRGNGYDRITLNGSNTWKLGKYLEASAAINLTESGRDMNNPGTLSWNRGAQVYPYAALADGAGNPLSYTRDLRESFVTASPAAGLLDWSYRPLDELRLADNRSTLTDVRVNSSLKYKLDRWIPGLNIAMLYQYDHGSGALRNGQVQESYFTRNLINRYTQSTGGMLGRPIPLGDIVDLGNSSSVNHDGRLQLSYDHLFKGKHALSAIAGYELQGLHVMDDRYRLYGFDREHATARQVDGVSNYFFYDNPLSSSTIPLGLSETDATDHYRSYYANAAYTYDDRYTLSASGRLDQSNLFGVRTNQKGVPLYSVGAAWSLSKEAFYDFSWLPYLKLRATYGYNGNVNKNLSAFTTASYNSGADSPTSLPYAYIVNPPNPELRWERIRNINLGLDFATKGEWLSGSLEYFWKQGLDLIGQTAFPPSSGITVFTGNTADTRGHGVDFTLNSRNLTGPLQWTTDFFASYITDQVTGYNQQSPAINYLSSGNIGAYALQGKPLFAIYSLPWAGLDPATGDPRGFLNGQVSKDYNAILGAATAQNLVYNGPSRPVVFGAFRNTFSYLGFSLSANIAYRLGYYFRRTSLRYGTDQGLSQQNIDYAIRWQQPGDEARTDVPSLPAASSLQRDDLYTYSSVLVEKGDHVRLQDVRLAYTVAKKSIPFLPAASLQVYVFATNLGIIWRANKHHLDPDYPNSFSAPRTVAAGLRITY